VKTRAFYVLEAPERPGLSGFSGAGTLWEYMLGEYAGAFSPRKK